MFRSIALFIFVVIMIASTLPAHAQDEDVITIPVQNLELKDKPVYFDSGEIFNWVGYVEDSVFVVYAKWGDWLLVSEEAQGLFGWAFDFALNVEADEIDVLDLGLIPEGNTWVIKGTYEVGCWDITIPNGINIRQGPFQEFAVLNSSPGEHQAIGLYLIPEETNKIDKYYEWFMFIDSVGGISYVASELVYFEECESQ